MLLLCDLYFVVFAASNLSLAFDALYDHRWACFDESYAIITGSGNATSPVYNVPSTCPSNDSTCPILTLLTSHYVSLVRVRRGLSANYCHQISATNKWHLAASSSSV